MTEINSFEFADGRLRKVAGAVEFWLQTMRGTDYLTYAKWPVKLGYNVTGPAEYAACW